jgi:hypothetical protein
MDDLKGKSTAIIDGRGDRSQDDLNFLVFPEPQNGPSSPLKDRVGSAIPRCSSRQLGNPPVSVVGGNAGVRGATMPKAPVHEDSNSLTRKCYVDTQSRLWDSPVLSEPKPTPMQR